jgi:hypothetical protein
MQVRFRDARGVTALAESGFFWCKTRGIKIFDPEKLIKTTL